MASYKMIQVDAFTDTPLGGNPCAVFFDTDDIDDATLLAIAKEMNLSETAFLRPSQNAAFAARYFTIAGEIPFAGHPTVASVYAMAASGRLPLSGERTAISLELKVGLIPVEILAQDGKVQQIVMQQKKPQFLAQLSPAEVMPVFGLDVSDVLPGAPVQIVSVGAPQVMIAVRSLDALRRIQVDRPAYEALRQRAGFFSPHLFCLEGATPAGRTFARHFGPLPAMLEDPFTGSSTGAMAAYLWRYGLIQAPAFIAEQGHWMGRPGKATVEVVGPPQDIQTVKVGGGAVAVLHGELTL